jgi:hypothetical protein
MRQLKVTSLGLCGLTALVVAGCRALTGEDIRRERQLGWIEFYGQPAVIQLPSTVSRGRDFDVVVTTYGGGCVDQGDTRVTTSATHAEIRPFDIFITEMPDDYACTDILKQFGHRATLRFTQAGTVTVRIHGRKEPSGDVIVVERQLTVQ